MTEPPLDPPPERDLDHEAELRAAAEDHWNECAVDREEGTSTSRWVEHRARVWAAEDKLFAAWDGNDDTAFREALMELEAALARY